MARTITYLHRRRHVGPDRHQVLADSGGDAQATIWAPKMLTQRQTRCARHCAVSSVYQGEGSSAANSSTISATSTDVARPAKYERSCYRHCSMPNLTHRVVLPPSLNTGLARKIVYGSTENKLSRVKHTRSHKAAKHE